MKYIYDLKELDKLGPAHLPAAQFATLIAIAERLEALIEAQKPLLVRFESYNNHEYPASYLINPREVVSVTKGHDAQKRAYTAIVTTKCNIEQGEFFPVDGDLNEVEAKLRGDK